MPPEKEYTFEHWDLEITITVKGYDLIHAQARLKDVIKESELEKWCQI